MKFVLPEYILEEKYILNEAEEDDAVTQAGDWATKLKNDPDLQSGTWQSYLKTTFGKDAAKVASLGKAILEEYKEYGFNPAQNPFIGFIKFLVDHNYNVNLTNYSYIHNAVVDDTISLKDIASNGTVAKTHLIYCKAFYDKTTNLQEYIKWQKIIINKIENNATIADRYKQAAYIDLDLKDNIINKKDAAEKINKYCLFKDSGIDPTTATTLLDIEALKTLVRDIFQLSPETETDNKKAFETGDFAGFIHGRTANATTALGYISAILSRKIWKNTIMASIVNKGLADKGVTGHQFDDLNITGREVMAKSVLDQDDGQDILSVTNEYLNGLKINTDNTKLQKEVALLLINIGSGEANWWELPKDEVK